ncbi:MAG TPA: hypothetical protein VGV09_06610 [Steroidobacteraceae bacterium]|nr:hypothetical protein [Steroidobacteraceae bacterium]
MIRSALPLFAAVLVSGCATGHLYPVQGPLLEQKPPPIYDVKMDRADLISARLGHGEVCYGNWLDVVKEDPSARDMEAEWDIVYGKGYFAANVLGHLGIARSTITCNKGTKVTFEFDSMKGVGKDDKGNVYRITF